VFMKQTQLFSLLLLSGRKGTANFSDVLLIT
jgi:hypothetical protein